MSSSRNENSLQIWLACMACTTVHSPFYLIFISSVASSTSSQSIKRALAAASSTDSRFFSDFSSSLLLLPFFVSILFIVNRGNCSSSYSTYCRHSTYIHKIHREYVYVAHGKGGRQASKRICILCMEDEQNRGE